MLTFTDSLGYKDATNGSFFPQTFDEHELLLSEGNTRKFLELNPDYLKDEEEKREPWSDITIGHDTSNGVSNTSSLPKVVLDHIKQRLFTKQYQNVFSYHPGEMEQVEIKLKLKPGFTLPKHIPKRHIGPAQTKVLNFFYDDMLRRGLYEPAPDAEFYSHLTLVAKPDGHGNITKLRVCGDYRIPNLAFPKQAQNLPESDEIRSRFSGRDIYSQFDLTGSFLQLRIHPSSRNILAVWTPKGIIRPVFMPFGPRNSSAIFQQELRKKLSKHPNYPDFIDAFIDDVLSGHNLKDTGDPLQDYMEHIETVFKFLDICKETGITLRPDKVRLLMKHVDFLGHKLSSEGDEPSGKHLEAIRNLQQPKNQAELLSSYHKFAWLNRHVKDFAVIAAPLTDLLKKKAKWDWSEQHIQAWTRLRDNLLKSPILCKFDPKKKLYLATDCSNIGLGAVLYHLDSVGNMRVISYLSHKLTSNEKNWPIYTRECYAIFFAVNKLRSYIDRSHGSLTIFTDHQPLLWILHAKGIRVAAWAIIMQDIHYEIKYTPGKTHYVPDALSRVPCIQHGVPTDEGILAALRTLLPYIPEEKLLSNLWLSLNGQEDAAKLAINPMMAKRSRIITNNATCSNLSRFDWTTAIFAPDAEKAPLVLRELLLNHYQQTFSVLLPLDLLAEVTRHSTAATLVPARPSKRPNDSSSKDSSTRTGRDLAILRPRLAECSKIVLASAGLVWITNHENTSDHVLAMSNITLNLDTTKQFVSMPDLTREQQSEPKYKKLLSSPLYKIINNALYYVGKDTKYPPRLYVPMSLRHPFIRNQHLLNYHMGIDRLHDHLKSRIYFPGLKDYITTITKSCFFCNVAKAQLNRHHRNYSALNVDGPGQILSFDFYESVPATPDGFTAILVMVDLFDNWTCYRPVSFI